MAAAEVGVFGGSGFYSFLDDVTEVAVDTPYGAPSAVAHVGTIEGRRVAFLPRHGASHEHPPHRINYRANLWAMHHLGVRRLLAPCASGSLRADVRPGEFVVCDQLVDRTSGRESTFFDGPTVSHLSFADPYCAELGALAVDAGRAEGITVHDRGTVVVVQGPRFSTRAESRAYAAAGFDVINMTQHPEAALAAELGICYSAIALVTDYDAGLEGVPGIEPVTQEEVFGFLDDNVDRVRALLFTMLRELPDQPHADCAERTGGVLPDPPPQG